MSPIYLTADRPEQIRLLCRACPDYPPVGQYHGRRQYVVNSHSALRGERAVSAASEIAADADEPEWSPYDVNACFLTRGIHVFPYGSALDDDASFVLGNAHSIQVG